MTDQTDAMTDVNDDAELPDVVVDADRLADQEVPAVGVPADEVPADEGTAVAKRPRYGERRTFEPRTARKTRRSGGGFPGGNLATVATCTGHRLLEAGADRMQVCGKSCEPGACGVLGTNRRGDE